MRWSYLLPRFIFLALVWAFFFFAFDPILKWSLRKGMEKAAGAKVEIAGVKTTFLHPSFRMTGVTVGSAEEEFTNVVEFAELKFDIAGAPLLEKKFIIDTASLSGLKFGTPRKTSAKLPFVKEETPKFIADLKAEGKDMAAERLGDLKGEAAGDVKNVEVSADSLSSVKVYQDLQIKYEAQYAELSKKAGSSEYQARIDVIKTKVEEANQQKDPLKKAKEFAKIQKDVKKVTEDFKNDRKLIEETAAGLQEGMKAAEEARRKDIEAVMGKMKMPGIDAQSLANMLAGPVMADKTQTAFKWLAMARKYMPDNSKKKAARQTDASRGRNVHFPKENTYPAFLIRKMSVSGEVGLDVPLDFAGTVEGITTQPQIYGKPLTALIKGAKAGRALNFKALLDNTGAVMKGDVSLKYSGMAVKELTLGKPGSIGAAVTGGTGRFDGDVNLTGENLRGDAMFRVEGAKVVPQADNIKVAQIKTAVLSSMSGLSSVGMGIKIGGTLKEPSLTLTTDLADKLANAFKGAFGAEFDKAKTEAQAKVDAALKPYKSKLESLTGSKQKEIKDKLDAGQKSVSGSGDGILDGLKEKAAPAGLGKVKLPKFKF